MAVNAQKVRIPMQLGSLLKIHSNGEISVSNPELQLEPSEAVADTILEYSFEPHNCVHVIQVVEPLSFNPRRRK